jgi:hypothetical protein
MIAQLVNAAAAVGIVLTPSEWSDYDYRQLLTYVAAVADGTLEQLWDAYRAEIEALVLTAPPQTFPWFRSRMLQFQFSATDPQVLEFDPITLLPVYPTTDTNLQVIKYCTVKPGAFGTTRILVAAQVSGLPADLDATYPGALAAAQSYVNLIAVPGLVYNVITGDADEIEVAADIYYQGAYSAVIQSRVEAAINAYLTGLPFDGIVLLTGIQEAILGVEGVNDVVFTTVKARAATTAYSGATLLVNANRWDQRQWQTQSGYIIPETTSGHTLADTLTYIPQ